MCLRRPPDLNIPLYSLTIANGIIAKPRYVLRFDSLLRLRCKIGEHIAQLLAILEKAHRHWRKVLDLTGGDFLFFDGTASAVYQKDFQCGLCFTKN
jgi:hypothetical protein